ncbi:MAG: hypothetical protein M5U24_14745 [Candidatus Kuenenia sp.]|uniref:hypothetical protein n=1 Tax=Candidatus Kuenenia sp. TaxID=2499824 RepID=UPI0022BE5902|nr:hypothetical protein [Candidatus Kuenenia sp.]MCZ7623706.1 hypothetical protein [Candidatus Kuenenia sp.]
MIVMGMLWRRSGRGETERVIDSRLKKKAIITETDKGRPVWLEKQCRIAKEYSGRTPEIKMLRPPCFIKTFWILKHLRKWRHENTIKTRN